MTNADRIRVMTDEELVDLVAHCCPPTFRYEIGHLCKGTLYNADCEGCWLDWLREEAKE